MNPVQKCNNCVTGGNSAVRYSVSKERFSNLKYFAVVVEVLDVRAVLSNGPAGPGPGPRAPKLQGAPNSPCVIFFIS